MKNNTIALTGVALAAAAWIATGDAASGERRPATPTERFSVTNVQTQGAGGQAPGGSQPPQAPSSSATS